MYIVMCLCECVCGGGGQTIISAYFMFICIQNISDISQGNKLIIYLQLTILTNY